MALKTLADLKVNDTVYYVYGLQINNSKVKMMDQSYVDFDSDKLGYHESELTSHQFKNYRERIYYLNKISALKALSKVLEKRTDDLILEQQKLFDKVKEHTQLILENNLLIVEETKNQK